MSENSPSVLRDFAPVPNRARRDKELSASHYRCLVALCTFVDNATGYTLIGQRALAKQAAVPRQKIPARLRDLDGWGYIAKVPRGRHTAGPRRGQIRTNLYRIIYDDADATSLATPGVAKVEPPSLATPGVAKALPPPGGASSRQGETKKESGPSIFRALREAERFDTHVEEARQMELPLPEVQHFDDLYRRATERHGSGAVVKIDMAIRKAHPSDRKGYLRALTVKLEELTTERPAELADVAATQRRRG